MIFYIPIKPNVEIQPKDFLKSPMGNHYQVVSYFDQEVLKLNPLDIYNDIGADFEFCIDKISLIEGGWKKRIH